MNFKVDKENLNELIRGRRSLGPKLFDSEAKIDDDIIWEILENANWAPTHGKTEPWRFQVFSENGKKKLSDFAGEIYSRHTPEEKFKLDKLEKVKALPLMCSHIISIGMKRHEKSSIREIEEVAAVSCAVQNMHLTAAAYGIAALWSTGGITYYPEAKPFFDLGPNDKLMGFFYLGYSAKPWPKGKRKDIAQKVKWNG